MNVPGRIAVLNREIERREKKIESVEARRLAGDTLVVLFLKYTDEYLANLKLGIEQREAELRRIQSLPQ